MAHEAHHRGVRSLLRGLLAAGLLATLLAAAPAWSSEVVQVRVGNHPTFTRVVFEFDAPSGYRVERHAKGEAENAILVTFDAASRARNIVSKSRGVESVSVDAAQGRAVARIVTREPGLPIKEMILTDPPRVVLDLMLAAGEPAVAQAEPVPPQPAPVPITDEPEPMAAEPAPAPAAEPDLPAAEPMPSAPSGPPETAFEPEEIAAPASPIEEEAEKGEAVASLTEEPPIPAPDAADRSPAAERPAAEPPAADQRSPEASDVRRRAAEARERIATEAESQAAPFDIATVGLVAGGVLALLLMVFFVVRRRRSAEDDVPSMAAAAEGAAPDEFSDEGRIPIGGFAMEAPADAEEHPAEDFELGGTEALVDEEKPIESIAAGPEAAPGLFDEAPEEKRAMTMDNQDLPIAHMDSEAATQLGIGANDFSVGGESDVARMVQEFERRIAHLETRLNESIDARERLERQVAAQSEELRVQRAAIARTQRALRSLNRSEEDQATEPALRDPSKPSGSPQ